MTLTEISTPLDRWLSVPASVIGGNEDAGALATIIISTP
jgi:hypothetical protein